jgi:hypothetical protein
VKGRIQCFEAIAIVECVCRQKVFDAFNLAIARIKDIKKNIKNVKFVYFSSRLRQCDIFDRAACLCFLCEIELKVS